MQATGVQGGGRQLQPRSADMALINIGPWSHVDNQLVVDAGHDLHPRMPAQNLSEGRTASMDGCSGCNKSATQAACCRRGSACLPARSTVGTGKSGRREQALTRAGIHDTSPALACWQPAYSTSSWSGEQLQVLPSSLQAGRAGQLWGCQGQKGQAAGCHATRRWQGRRRDMHMAGPNPERR